MKSHLSAWSLNCVVSWIKTSVSLRTWQCVVSLWNHLSASETCVVSLAYNNYIYYYLSASCDEIMHLSMAPWRLVWYYIHLTVYHNSGKISVYIYIYIACLFLVYISGRTMNVMQLCKSCFMHRELTLKILWIHSQIILPSMIYVTFRRLHAAMHLQQIKSHWQMNVVSHCMCACMTVNSGLYTKPFSMCPKLYYIAIYRRTCMHGYVLASCSVLYLHSCIAWNGWAFMYLYMHAKVAWYSNVVHHEIYMHALKVFAYIYILSNYIIIIQTDGDWSLLLWAGFL